MAAGSILLLENNQKIAQTLELAFHRAGFKIMTLPWGEDIVDALKSRPTDAVLLNIRQLGTSSRAICQKVREQQIFKRFPLLIIYGKPNRESRADWLKAGADDYVPMPFTPVELVAITEARLRPFTDILKGKKALSRVDRQQQAIKEEKTPVAPLPPRGDLELVPLPAVLSRIFFKRESGTLTIIIKKETRTIYFELGGIVFSESNSRKDDLGDYMARNGAGTGSGKEIIAARNQAGGPGCDPREFRLILYESKLMDTRTFSWWAQMHTIDLVASLFAHQIGSYQWQNLPLPDHAKEIGFSPIYTPRIIFEGTRQLTKWWNYRQLLPKEESIPALVENADELMLDFGLTLKEITMLSIINGRRPLKEIREICHQAAQMIDNFIFAGQQLNLIQFDIKDRTGMKPEIDIHEEITEDMEDKAEPVDHVRSTHESDRTGQQEIMDDSAEEMFFSPSSEKATMPDFSSPPPAPPAAEPLVPVPEKTVEMQPVAVSESFETGSGKLTVRPISEIFRLSIKREFTGALFVENLGITKTVFWKRGKIITATSTDIDERLDNLLYRRHMITLEQRDDIRRAPPELIGSPNEMLKRRILTIEQIFKVVKDQVEAIIKDLFCWVEGTYRIDPEFQAPRDMVPLDISPTTIVMSALRDLTKWDHLLSYLPQENEIIRMADRSRSEQMGLNLSPLELRIMNILSESIPTSDVVRRTGQPLLTIQKSLYAMDVAGLIQRLGKL